MLNRFWQWLTRAGYYSHHWSTCIACDGVVETRGHTLCFRCEEEIDPAWIGSDGLWIGHEYEYLGRETRF